MYIAALLVSLNFAVHAKPTEQVDPHIFKIQDAVYNLKVTSDYICSARGDVELVFAGLQTAPDGRELLKTRVTESWGDVTRDIAEILVDPAKTTVYGYQFMSGPPQKISGRAKVGMPFVPGTKDGTGRTRTLTSPDGKWLAWVERFQLPHPANGPASLHPASDAGEQLVIASVETPEQGKVLWRNEPTPGHVACIWLSSWTPDSKGLLCSYNPTRNPAVAAPNETLALESAMCQEVADYGLAFVPLQGSRRCWGHDELVQMCQPQGLTWNPATTLDLFVRGVTDSGALCFYWYQACGFRGADGKEVTNDAMPTRDNWTLNLATGKLTRESKEPQLAMPGEGGPLPEMVLPPASH